MKIVYRLWCNKNSIQTSTDPRYLEDLMRLCVQSDQENNYKRVYTITRDPPIRTRRK